MRDRKLIFPRDLGGIYTFVIDFSGANAAWYSWSVIGGGAPGPRIRGAFWSPQEAFDAVYGAVEEFAKTSDGEPKSPDPTEIVQHLREHIGLLGHEEYYNRWYLVKAADEIEFLRGEVERLKAENLRLPKLDGDDRD